MKGQILFIFISLILALSANVYSQNETSFVEEEIDIEQQTTYQRAIDKLDFSDTETKWKLKEKKKKANDEDDELQYDPATNRPRAGFSFNGGFTNILAYLLILIMLMALIYMVIASVKTDTKIKNIETVEDHIEDIEAVDTLDGFKQALLAGDYRSALRMQFIKVLQLLQENNKINWRAEKTNKDYLRELSGSDQKNSFRNLSGIYELVWYGNTKIDKESFEQLNPSFETFINGFNG